MKAIYEKQILLYQTSFYDKEQHRFRLQEDLLLELQEAVQEYIDDRVSYSNDEERLDLIEFMTIGSIEEVVTALKKNSDSYIAQEIIRHLERV